MSPLLRDMHSANALACCAQRSSALCCAAGAGVYASGAAGAAAAGSPPPRGPIMASTARWAMALPVPRAAPVHVGVCRTDRRTCAGVCWCVLCGTVQDDLMPCSAARVVIKRVAVSQTTPTHLVRRCPSGQTGSRRRRCSGAWLGEGRRWLQQTRWQLSNSGGGVVGQCCWCCMRMHGACNQRI